MDVVITTSIIAFLLSLLDSKGLFNKGLALGFVLIAIPLVIHYDYGNDYMSYYYKYLQISELKISWIDVFSKSIVRNNEYVWAWIMMFFSLFGRDGFFLMVASLSIIELIIYYNSLTTYVSKEWRWLAFFIFLFSPTFYPLMFSMLRQSFTIAGFLLVFNLIQTRKLWIPLLCIIFLSNIHSSAIALFPFVLIKYIDFKHNKPLAISLFVLFIVFFISKDLMSVLFGFLTVLDKVSNYAEDYGRSKDIVSFGFGFLLNCIPLLVYLNCFFFDKVKNKVSNSILLLASIYFIVMPFSRVLPSFNRVAFYFEAFSIMAVPISYQQIKSTQIRNALISLLILLHIYSYLAFFNGEVFGPYYRDFHTIFKYIS